MTPRILFSSDEIRRRVKELGAQISEKHPDGDVLLIGILKGCFMFMADLSRSLTVPSQIDFVRISSYGSGTESSGELRILLDITMPVKDRAVILVDDIVDSGLTLNEYRGRIESLEPKSVETAALINKTGRREKHVSLDYCGFELESGFIVGYGLDCDENFRSLGDLFVLE